MKNHLEERLCDFNKTDEEIKRAVSRVREARERLKERDALVLACAGVVCLVSGLLLERRQRIGLGMVS